MIQYVQSVPAMPNQSSTGLRPTRSLMAPSTGCIAAKQNRVMNDSRLACSRGSLTVLARKVGMYVLKV